MMNLLNINNNNLLKLKQPRAVEFPFVLFLLLFILPLPSMAQQSDSADPLQGYLLEAAGQNPSLQANFNRYLAALQESPQAGALPDPELAFGYFVTPVETRVGPQSARISLMQMLPWFGTLGARKEAAALNARARFSQFQDQRNHLFYEVKEKWYSLYMIKQEISILEENITILETFENIALQNYETGTGSQSDVLQVQVELEDLQTQKELLLNDKRVLLTEFNELLSQPGGEAVTGIPDSLAPPELPMAEDTLRQRVLENNPRLLELDFREQSAEESITAARRAGYPTLGVGADYILTGERDLELADNGKNAFVAKLSVQIPLFRGKYRAQKEQAELRRNAVQDEVRAAQNNLVSEIERALRNYRNSERQYDLYSVSQIQRTLQMINLLQEEYASGSTSFEEVLRYQRRLLEYQLAKQEALGEQYIALARLEYLAGAHNIQPEEVSFNPEQKRGFHN